MNAAQAPSLHQNDQRCRFRLVSDQVMSQVHAASVLDLMAAPPLELLVLGHDGWVVEAADNLVVCASTAQPLEPCQRIHPCAVSIGLVRNTWRQGARSAIDCAARAMQAAVQVQHTNAAGAFMQIVHVSRTHLNAVSISNVLLPNFAKLS